MNGIFAAKDDRDSITVLAHLLCIIPTEFPHPIKHPQADLPSDGVKFPIQPFTRPLQLEQIDSRRQLSSCAVVLLPVI